MTKEQYFELKDYLKTTAKEIKLNKSERRTSQQDRTNFYKENGSWNSWTTEQNIKYRDIQNSFEKAFHNAKSNSETYRYAHIAYCIARGRSYNQIEQKVHKQNKINFEHLKNYFFKVWDIEIPANLKEEIESAVMVSQ
jgi:hypothetical protein